ncbi:septal ring lytic transglycosylase RlpA family protein [Falsiroseomonas selenitidurans]|uniref:Endolytic peptidoglycan transglycosylase RlpA n=1 Tax=Falsiroseomonas selenitidurans TaxID=2716335 RepID=A0ABX1E2U5_9PROT|nr:SPOR domain-containing protein [Falsiroseomonas selenitidurans]NKC31490.1 septal ring lytic transglycosylase RlpA family protein [Falsiroseomonas selenitidurans]
MRLATIGLPAALALAVLAGCGPRRPAEQAQPRYTVGEPYQMGGVWSYPREDFALDTTGLASVAADARAGRRTSNGEIHDPAALSAAHRTLQMPALLMVTNLETGLRTTVRVNDRGPANPGRVVALSRRAAQLLGVPPGGAAQVRIEVVGEPSRALAAGLPTTEAAPLRIEAAPLGTVEQEALAPPPGATQAGRLRAARPLPGAGQAGAALAAATAAAPPLRLAERLERVPAQPGRLWVETATFSRRDMAERQAARLFGLRARVEALGGRGRGAQPSYRVRLGPFASVAEADRALEGTLRAGVSEARILVD